MLMEAVQAGCHLSLFTLMRMKGSGHSEITSDVQKLLNTLTRLRVRKTGESLPKKNSCKFKEMLANQALGYVFILREKTF